MANEHIIHTHESYKEAGRHDGHPGLASQRRREEEANNKLREHNREAVLYEARTGIVEGDQFTPFDWDRIQEIRDELRSMCE